jgi:hypothetical protein
VLGRRLLSDIRDPCGDRAKRIRILVLCQCLRGGVRHC